MASDGPALLPPRPDTPELSNWGVFGDDDEIGTLNYLTPEAVLRGVRSIRLGHRYPISLPADVPSGPGGTPSFKPDAPSYRHDTFRRLQHRADGTIVNDDAVTVATQASSQWDALVHVGMPEAGVDGVFYNGRGIDVVDEAGYAHHNGIDHLARAGIAGRGVLLDVARFVAGGSPEPLPLTHRITPEETAACAKAEGIEILPGDIVCYRTGYAELHLDAKQDQRADLYELLTTSDDPSGLPPVPGITADHAPMAHEQRWAAVVGDNTGVEALPLRPHPTRSAHIRMMRNLGLIFGELFLFRDLAAACAADGNYEFLFVAAPMWIPGGMGSPGNGIAIR